MTTDLGHTVRDGLGRTVTLAAPPRRIVSLVPSLTEAVYALGCGADVVGRTDYCVQPAALVADVPAVGGTKTPNLQQIRALAPDLVLASAEENVREHVTGLMDAGLTVYVSLPETVQAALTELADLAVLLHRPPDAAPWLVDAQQLLARLEARRGHTPARYFCPIWRRPYMVAAPHTYMSDLLRVCGGVNIFDHGSARYYAVELGEVERLRPDVVLLPDEPYPFAARHTAEIRALTGVPAVQHNRIHLVDGQLLTWYGPRTAAALRTFAALLDGGA